MSQDDQSESTEAAPNRDPMAAARLLLGGSAHSDSGTDGPIEASGPRGDDEVAKDETAAGRISSAVLSMEHLLSTTANNKFEAVYRAAASEFGVTAADLYLTFINKPGNANVRLVKQMAPDSPSRLVLGLCGSDDLKSKSYPNQSRRLFQAHLTVEAVVLLFRDDEQGWTAKLGYARSASQLIDVAKLIWPKAVFEEIGLSEAYAVSEDSQSGSDFTNSELGVEGGATPPLVAGASRNPAWTWDEQILAFDLFLREGWLDRRHPAVEELSAVLNALTIYPASSRTPSFRNPNGVGRKLADIQTHQPGYAGKQTSGSRLDREVWERYGHQPRFVAQLANAIREGAQLAGGREEDEEDIEAVHREGRITYFGAIPS